MRDLLRELGLVIVDADAYRQTLDMAVLGEAYRIVLAEQERWLLMETTEEES